MINTFCDVISKTGLHTIRALAELARLDGGEFLGASALARRIDAPPNYLGKLLQSLTRSGLVESRKGLGGGFRLGRNPAEVSLLDVLEPIDHVGRWRGCFLGGSTCSDEDPCVVHDRWGELRDMYLALLGKTMIADLIFKDPVVPHVPTGRESASRSGTGRKGRA